MADPDQAEQLRQRMEALAQARATGQPFTPPPMPKRPRPAPIRPATPQAVSPPKPSESEPEPTRPVNTVPPKPIKGYICANCGKIAKPRTVTRGNILIEIILWLAFLIPGLIYSIWRLTTRYKACPHCLAPNPVPLDSPRGRKLLDEYGWSP